MYFVFCPKLSRSPRPQDSEPYCFYKIVLIKKRVFYFRGFIIPNKIFIFFFFFFNNLDSKVVNDENPKNIVFDLTVHYNINFVYRHHPLQCTFLIGKRSRTEVVAIRLGTKSIASAPKISEILKKLECSMPTANCTDIEFHSKYRYLSS